ncbi:hypothetical protein AB205_0109260, partial [Aquarana catesbeiana]
MIVDRDAINEEIMNAKFKEPEFLSAFIDQYREMRNLWEVKHPQYYLKHYWYYNKLRFLDDQTEARASLSTLPSTLPCTLPCTLPSTPAKADKDQAGSSILEELDVTIWSQDKVNQEESGESGRQEEAGPRDSQEEAGPCVIQEEDGPCVIQEEAGPCVIQEEAGSS